MSPNNFPPASVSRETYQDIQISREQFFDLLLIALADGDADGSGEPPWDLQETADRNGLMYQPEWIDEFVHKMENTGTDVIMSDSKSIPWPDDRICVYPNTGAYTPIPLLQHAYYGELGFDDYVFANIGSGLVEAPASDRTVPLNHNSETYKDAIEKVEVAAEAIHGFNGETGYDSEELVGELAAARTLFKSPKVRIGAVLAIALTPLYTAYNDVGAEALKPVVLTAIEAVKLLFGL